jgi:hypothetical protein
MHDLAPCFSPYHVKDILSYDNTNQQHYSILNVY